MIAERSELVSNLEFKSQKLENYLNNLDETLGLETTTGLNPGLDLLNGKLYINDQDWDWYIVDKHPKEDFFKVVGLHKTDSIQNLVYVLGRNKGWTVPFLYKVDSKYLEGSSAKKCLKSLNSKPLPGFVKPTIIGCAIAVVLGFIVFGVVHLMGSGQSVVASVVTTAPAVAVDATIVGADAAIRGLLGILPVAFAVMIILGILRAFAGGE